MDRFARTLTAWIAVAAFLMAALAPSISHALGGQNARPWTEICTSAGATSAQRGTAWRETAPVPVDVHAFEHCPYCSLQHHAVALPPAAVAVWVPMALDAPWPVAFMAASHTPHAWVTAQPRAPPTFF